jgi:ribose 5-phosphate isomerase A
MVARARRRRQKRVFTPFIVGNGRIKWGLYVSFPRGASGEVGKRVEACTRSLACCIHVRNHDENERRPVSDTTEVKKALGAQAVDRFVNDGMRLGLGTGSTAIWAVRRVAERMREGSLREVLAVTTSLQSELEARGLGVPVVTFNDAVLGCELDLTIDGADEVDSARNLIKGGGGALLKEKIVAYSSRRLLIIVGSGKLSERLCERFAVPVEVVADAVATVTRRIEAVGGEATLRMGVKKAGPVVTDLGNLLLDVVFRRAFDPRSMEDALKCIPGVLENGLFTKKIPELLIGHADGTMEYRE